MISWIPTDSVALPAAEEAEWMEWPSAPFPEYTHDRLREFAHYLLSASDGDLSAGLPALSSSGLYTLLVVVARTAGVGGEPTTLDRRIAAQLPAVTPALCAELRRRDYRGLGDDPTGPVRRGRLLQLVGAFTPLAPFGATFHQRQKMLGACPFCSGAEMLQVSLPAVTWRCFGCDQSGGLREFAECLLTRALQVLECSVAPGHLP